MKQNKYLRILILILIATNLATILSLNQKNKEKAIPENHAIETEDYLEDEDTDEKIVAKIDGIEISYDDWIRSLRNTYGEKHLKEMIDQVLVQRVAEEQKIELNEKIIDRDVNYLLSMLGPIDKETLEKETEELRKKVVFKYQLQEILAKDAEVPESEISNHFNVFREQYDFEASIQLSHIVVDQFSLAEKVIQELDSGASFHMLAQEYSIDDETRSSGGYLGHFSKTSQFLPREYFSVAEGMEEFTYSEPFQTDQGVVILYLYQRLPEVTFTYEELKQTIKNELALKKLEIPLTTDPLWESFPIEWIYGENH